MNTQQQNNGDLETLMRRIPNTDDAVTLALLGIRGELRAVGQAYDSFRSPASMAGLEAFIESRDVLLERARRTRDSLDALIRQLESPDFGHNNGKDGH